MTDNVFAGTINLTQLNWNLRTNPFLFSYAPIMSSLLQFQLFPFQFLWNPIRRKVRAFQIVASLAGGMGADHPGWHHPGVTPHELFCGWVYKEYWRDNDLELGSWRGWEWWCWLRKERGCQILGKIGWHHHLPHRVTPTLVTPLFPVGEHLSPNITFCTPRDFKLSFLASYLTHGIPPLQLD